MKAVFNRLALRKKLILVIMLACGLLLMTGFGVVLLAEVAATRAALEDEMQVLGTSLTANGRRPLVLGRHERLDGLLESLATQTNIHAAYFFDEQGIPLAEYLKQQRTDLVIKALKRDFPEGRLSWTPSGERFSGNAFSSLGMFTPIYFEGRQIGTLYLLSDLNDLYTRTHGILAGSAFALVLLVACSWPLADRLQRPVSRPILDLARLTQEISRTRNYAIRATPGATDEVGTLVAGFNRMLDQIEEHQRQLAAHRDQLELRVAERTEELSRTVVQLREAQAAAEQANAAKSAFLSRMTHELRTPLIGVLGMNELLERTRLTDQQATLVATIHKSGEELLRLINDVLDLSRVEAGRLELDPQPLDLYRTVEEVVVLLAPQARDKGLVMELDIPRSATVKVLADDTRVRQTLTNLLGNAIRYTDSGTVSVRLLRTAHSGKDADFLLEVADTGCGMDKQTRARIFDVFYQGTVPGTGDRGGAGLGLAIVQQLVALMDGELELSTEPGMGSRFSLNLPLPVLSGPLDPPEELSGVAVLICLATAASAALLQRRLEELGLSVTVAGSAEDALYRLRAVQRTGRSAPLLLTDPHTVFTDGSSLMDLILRDGSGLAPRTILLENQPAARSGCPGGLVPLDSPLTWAGLQQALWRVRRELRLVMPEEQSRAPRPASPNSGLRGRVLLIGMSPASRELLQISLENQGCTVIARDPGDVCPEDALNNELRAVFIDGTALGESTLESLLGVLRPGLTCPCYLVGNAIPERSVMHQLDGCLQKPLKSADLAEILPTDTQDADRQGEPR